MITIVQLNKQIIEIGSEIKKAQSDKIIYEKRLFDKDNQLINIGKAIEILTAVLMLTQTEVISFIEDIVGTALRYVYGEEYGFKMEFELKRNQPELNMYPTKNDMLYDPKFSCGVGISDVCSFALRCAIWTLMPNRPDSVLILDEPFKNLNGVENNERVGLMVKTIADMLNIQIIIVSSKSTNTNYADKNFMVQMNEKGISQVQEIVNV
jgi:hypothetical protein